MAIIESLAEGDERWWNKFNPEVVDGIEQIEEEQLALDASIRKDIERPIFNAERNLTKLQTRTTQPIATNLNKTISTLNNLYTDTQNNIEGRIATLSSNIPSIAQTIPSSPHYLGLNLPDGYLVPLGYTVYRWNNSNPSMPSDHWSLESFNCSPGQNFPNPTTAPSQGYGFYQLPCTGGISPPTPPPSQPPSPPMTGSCTGVYPPPVPVPIPIPFPANSCLWRWYGTPTGWFNEHCQCDMEHQAIKPSYAGSTIGETVCVNCIPINGEPPTQPPPTEPPTSEPPLPPLPPTYPPVLPPSGQPCPPPVINVSCPTPIVNVTNQPPVVNVNVSCPPNGKPTNEPPPTQEPPEVEEPQEPPPTQEPPTPPPVVPPPPSVEPIIDCNVLEEQEIVPVYCSLDTVEKLVDSLETSLKLGQLDRILLSLSVVYDSVNKDTQLVTLEE